MINTQTLTDQIIEGEASYLAQTYKRPPFVLVHGDGMTLFDSEGNAYTDWVAGIAVNIFGYNDAGVQRAITAQLANGIIHTSNLYHTAPHVRLAKLLVEHSFADRVFFTNSGTEANEAAIKFARKLAYEAGKPEKHELVTFSNAFHGRTMGSITLTPREKYQKPFKPLLPGVKVAEFNNLASAQAIINDNTAAVFVEPIQGEGGINVATTEFLKGLRDLCDQHSALLVFDEIQCGMGRTGTLWAHEPSGTTPDIMTIAKPLAAGLPIGAVLMTQRVADAMHVGEHGSTFAGGPLVTSVALEVLSRVTQPDFLTHVQTVGAYLIEQLSKIVIPIVKDVRGRGLMVGLELTRDVAARVVELGYAHGLLMVNAGANVIRFVPPLIAEKSHVNQLVGHLTTILEHVNNE
ncbi:MAG: aspartate aminotransferase family protein [Phototrophicales bacterium]|nr:MAG: aspartate aminotransferase family protein [Phototrophicales bacterium]